ncbi:undecaprenyldiphospho-muramoylpentapeptide beta-N-acetylglucosaminyltransferase [Pollutibacter soli]|uniref:undecaprenyldiphospho-muramoylpentapeptide beta-N-acetylglucosaminyltransferase n=1 Tax=Pollutibacter soli TaxID=3034157 RepID=UPI0030135DD8
MNRRKIIIAGGGTGGHIFPAIAIAQAIKKITPDTDFLFIGAKGKMEMEKVPQAGFRIEGLDIAGFNRSALYKNFGLPIKIIKSFIQVRRIFKTYQPDAVIGVGGYSSFPVLRWAQRKGIPTFIHESNSIAGRANIMLGKKATEVFVATEGMEKYFPAEVVRHTGNPVRDAIAGANIGREEGVVKFGLDPFKKTIFCVGGSLGARSINESIDAGLTQLLQQDIQVIWQTGKPYAEKGRNAAKGIRGISVHEFITEMQFAYAAADLVISRAGAMAISEICVAGKPAVFVPFPHAAEDHQTINALTLEKKHAAVIVPDNQTKATLVPVIIALLKDSTRLETMKNNAAALAVRDADEKIATLIIKKLDELKK